MSDPLPPTCSVAFKEWAGVCRAIADGRQALILRKGGIAESGPGFRPEHDLFWLYPTHLHEHQQGLRVEMPPSDAAPLDVVPIDTLVRVESVDFLDDPHSLAALAPFHVWTGETVRKRFHYRTTGLWVLGVRAFRREPAYEVIPREEYAGCKTWVPLAELLATDGLRAVLRDEESDSLLREIRAAFGQA